jgi:hypothetical protein
LQTKTALQTKVLLNVDLYVLNKVNAGKPSFTKDKETIIAHKFKYFKKDKKKGKIHSKQLFVATRPQACPYVKVLPCKDFTKNTVD